LGLQADLQSPFLCEGKDQAEKPACLQHHQVRQHPAASVLAVSVDAINPGLKRYHLIPMIRTTIGSFSLILSVALMTSTSGKPAKASTWHSDKSVNGYYCPGGGKRVHLEDCPQRDGGKRQGRPGASAVRDACAGDIKRFCSAVIEDSPARRACMRAHHD